MTTDDRLQNLNRIWARLPHVDDPTLQWVADVLQAVTKPVCVGREDLRGFVRRDTFGIYRKEDVDPLWDHLLKMDGSVFDIHGERSLVKLVSPDDPGAYVITIAFLQAFVATLRWPNALSELSPDQQLLLLNWVKKL